MLQESNTTKDSGSTQEYFPSATYVQSLASNTITAPVFLYGHMYVAGSSLRVTGDGCCPHPEVTASKVINNNKYLMGKSITYVVHKSQITV